MKLPNCFLTLDSQDSDWRWYFREVCTDVQRCVAMDAMKAFLLKQEGEGFTSARLKELIDILGEESLRDYKRAVYQLHGLNIAPKRERVKIGQPLLG